MSAFHPWQPFGPVAACDWLNDRFRPKADSRAAFRVPNKLWQEGHTEPQEGRSKMERKFLRTPILRVAVALVMSATVLPCQAGSTGNGTAGSGQARFNNGMGLQQFRYETDAQKHCANDSIVWGSSANPGKFFTKGAGPQRVGGFFACMAEARNAGYAIVTGQ